MSENEASAVPATRPPDTVAFSAAIGLAALTLYLLVVGQSILVPLVLAILITYLLKALAHGLERIRIGGKTLPSGCSLAVSIFILIIFIALLVQLVAGNVNAIVDAAPAYQEKLQALFSDLKARMEQWFGMTLTIAELNERIDFQSAVLRLVGALQSIASNTFQIFLYVAFLLLESRTIDLKIKAFASTTEREQAIKSTLFTLGRNIEMYVWIKTSMSLLVGGLSYVIMLIAGVDFAAFWALLIFILNYIPYIGSIVAVTFPVVLSVLQFGSPALTGLVLAGLMGAQVIVGNVVEPRITGTSLNLSPVIIVLALSVWGSIWGVTGMILSVPIMVMAMIVLAQFPRTKALAILMSQSGEIK
ncbi:MAG: AI-2E family transporter [Rhodospirillaceae bacterium]|nr:AI-2E family transporter [Rhodospirillaceae bacterium]